MALWIWICVTSQTCSGKWNKSSTAGTSVGFVSQGHRGGWWPRTHWKGERSVEACQSKFWTYLAQEPSSDMLALMTVCMQKPPQILNDPLCLPVGFGVLAGGETYGYSQFLEEGSTHRTWTGVHSLRGCLPEGIVTEHMVEEDIRNL